MDAIFANIQNGLISGIFPDTGKVRIKGNQAITLDGNVACKEHGTPRNYRIYEVYGCESLNFRDTIRFILNNVRFRYVFGNFIF